VRHLDNFDEGTRQSAVADQNSAAHAALSEIRRRLREEEGAYTEALAALDAIAAYSLPEEEGPEVRELLAELNELGSQVPEDGEGGLRGAVAARVRRSLAPVIEQQKRFDQVLVRLLNAQLEHLGRHHARLREMAGTLVRYAQRIEPFMDARDQMRVAETPTQTDQVLEVFAEKLEKMGRSVDGLAALRDRIEALSEEVRAVRRGLEAGAPPPEVARATTEAADDSAYTAFENRFRGSEEEIRRRQKGDAELFRGLEPVADLGCGRGEFLELLRDEGIEAQGVESNAHAVKECRNRGLDVVQGDLVEFLRRRDEGSLGGIFAAQVAEHLPPPVLAALLAEAHRTLRRGGLLLLETPNAASVVGFHGVFLRDVTHERPLHPETMRFLASAAGFSDVRIQMRNPVPEDVSLQFLPGSAGLPPQVIKHLNENIGRLNALVFAPQDYALLARR
jgi:SAM-dependent methyltransferase